MSAYQIRPSRFGDFISIPMPTGCDMIVVFADLHQHVPVWIGLPHQLYVETARRLLTESGARSLTVAPYRNADKVEVCLADIEILAAGPVPATSDGADLEAAREDVAAREIVDALDFFDRVLVATERERIAVGRDHWDRLENACRAFAALRRKEDEPGPDGEAGR